MNQPNMVQELSGSESTYNTSIRFFEQERKEEKCQKVQQKALKGSTEQRSEKTSYYGRLGHLFDCGKKTNCNIM